MAADQWYYAQGSSDEKGPVSTPQLKQLIASGQLKPEDQVWKEGMADWKAVREVPELAVAAETPRPMATQAEPIAPAPAAVSAKSPSKASNPIGNVMNKLPTPVDPAQARGMAKLLGMPLLLLGLVMVLMARGCDETSRDAAARTKADYLIKSQYEDIRYAGSIADKQGEIRRIRNKEKAGDNDTKNIEDIEKDIKKLEKDANEAKAKRDNGEAGWANSKYEAQVAEAVAARWVYWWSVLRLLGNVCFALGLVCLAVTTTGTIQVIVFIILAIVAYGLFGAPIRIG